MAGAVRLGLSPSPSSSRSLAHPLSSPPQEPEKKPNYEEQVSKELDRVQQRVLLLNEMLNNANPRERFVEGDAYDVRPPLPRPSFCVSPECTCSPAPHARRSKSRKSAGTSSPSCRSGSPTRQRTTPTRWVRRTLPSFSSSLVVARRVAHARTSLSRRPPAPHQRPHQPDPQAVRRVQGGRPHRNGRH